MDQQVKRLPCNRCGTHLIAWGKEAEQDEITCCQCKWVLEGISLEEQNNLRLEEDYHEAWYQNTTSRY